MNKKNEYVIREMIVDDIEAAAALLARYSSETPWTGADLLTYYMRDDALFLVIEEKSGRADVSEPAVIGFAGLLLSPPEADILDITIAEGFRNMGFGRRLLEELLEDGEERGVSIFHLEVRVGNAPARHLYEKLGFREAGLRKNYYTDPTEDAVTMNR